MNRILLNSMHHTTGADHCSGNRQGCLGGTRVGVLQQLEEWLEDEQSQHVFWLNGLAGTGKSTIAQTFAEIAFAEGKLGASFFCSQDVEDRSSLEAILPTLAFQLAYRYPLYREQLLQVLRANPGIGRGSLCPQMETLIVGPFQATQVPTLIIIDALDECRDEEPASALLSVLSRYVDKIPLVKFFITGRPEPRIRSGFRLVSLRPHTEILRLHAVKPDVVDSDIKLFLKTQLADITKNRSNFDLVGEWPSAQDIDALCKKAAGFFIYASTVVKFVASQYDPPDERLALIISLPHDTSHEGKEGIDLLYTKVLEQAFDGKDQAFYLHFKLVVGTVLLIFNPLSIKALSDLLGNHSTQSRICSILRALHSLLLVPDNIEDVVHIFHKSFPDFLTHPGRCKDERFFINPSVYHQEILLSCLDIMKRGLRRDICKLGWYTLLSEVEDLPTHRATHIGGALGYACRFWTTHLIRTASNSPDTEEVQKEIDEFFTTHLLFWMEVLSLMGNLDVGVYALHDIDQWYIKVSYMWRIYLANLYLCPLRQESHAGGQMTASGSSWNTLIQSMTLLSRSTILPSHFALPHLGSVSTTVQCS